MEDVSGCVHRVTACPGRKVQPLPGGTLQPRKAPLLTPASEPVQSQAQVLSLYISRAFDRVKILLEVFGKLCRTWLILDFPKFILSVRPLSDFILGPKALFTSSVHLLNQQISKQVP